MSEAVPHLARLAPLDGLRGLAALAVVFAHATIYLGLLPWPPLGGIGVLVFFVLSGYLIARVTLRLPTDWSGYYAFMRRRVARLGPVVIVVSLAVPLGLSLAGVPTAEAAWSGAQAITQTTGIGTVLGAPMHITLMPTWSLTTEWTFYVFFPLAVLAARRRGVPAKRLQTACIIVAPMLWLVALPFGFRAFYLLPVANLGVMCAGAALALAHHRGWQGPALLSTGPAPSAGLSLILLLVALPGGQLGWAYDLVLLPAVTLGSLAVVHGVHLGRGIRRLLSPRWLSAVGLRAYSLYLWHVPCLWFAWRMLPDRPWQALVIGLSASGVVTAMSFRLLERPVLPAVGHGGAPKPAAAPTP